MYIHEHYKVPNYDNLIRLHNWLYENRHKVKFCAGVWVGKYRNQDGHPFNDFWFVGDNADEFDLACAFGWAAMSGVPELALIDNDFMHFSDKMVAVDWCGYIERVFSLHMGTPEYNFINSHRWRNMDNSVDGLIARIRFILDDPLNSPTNADTVDILAGRKPIPYDILENSHYDKHV